MIGLAGWTQAKAVARATIGKATIAVAVAVGNEMAKVGDMTAVVVGMRMAAVAVWAGVVARVGEVAVAAGTAVVGGLRRRQLCRNSQRKGVGWKKVALVLGLGRGGSGALPTTTTVVVERRKQARAMHARARAMHPKAMAMHPRARVVHARAKVGHQRARTPGPKSHLPAHLGPTAPPLQYLLHPQACKIVRRAALAARARHLHPQQRSTWSISASGRT